ncbi:MAG: cysteine desulfurase [candidate division Zixibacteria bacterium]|nr:cysteine desulfurase [candidate division Zixibacteria bacterium]
MNKSTDIRQAEAKPAFDPERIKQDFPILKRHINGKRLVYLDSSATTQKPLSVIKAIENYYGSTNANVHRGLHTLAEESTLKFEETRQKIADFIGGAKTSEIIYTRSTTESINLVASSWGAAHIKTGDRIVTTQMEHHANLVPWIVLAKKTGAELEYIPIDDDGYLDLSNLDKIITRSTKLVAVTHMSNVLGTINPVEAIIERARKIGATVLIDGAQAAPHMPVNVKSLDVDFYVFSAHKMLGPTGIGVLYGKERILEEMEPYNLGGEMINVVKFDYADWAELPHKFEAGTPNIAGVIGFKPALDYLNALSMESVRNHEIEITEYALERMSRLNNIKIFGPMNVDYRGGSISFVDKDVHSHDIAQFLDSLGIAVRAGHHCAMPLTKLLGEPATSRASFYVYNTKDDVDRLIGALREMRRYFGYE